MRYDGAETDHNEPKDTMVSTYDEKMRKWND